MAVSELTGKQKRFLRRLGHDLPPACAIGKAGLSEAAIENVSRVLADRELIKVRLPAGPPGQRREMAEQIALAVGARCAGVLGRTGLLFRPNEQIDPADRIALP